MLITWCIVSTILLVYVIVCYINIDCKYDDFKEKFLNQELKVWFSNVTGEPIYTKDFNLVTRTRIKISSEKDFVKMLIGTQEYKMTTDEFSKMNIEISFNDVKL